MTESGKWYHAHWVRDDGIERSSRVFEEVSVLWLVNEWTAEQAASFAVGLVGRDQLPQRRIPIRFTEVRSRFGKLVETKFDY